MRSPRLGALRFTDAASAAAVAPSRPKLDFYSTAVPVNLNGQATLQPGDSGIAIGKAFANPLPVPLELREIKWGLTSAAASGGTVALNGIAVEVAIRYGVVPITSAPIPLCSLSPQVNAQNENNAFNGVSNGTFLADQYAAVFGRVKLDEPLYLLPGELLDCSLNHRGLVTTPIVVNLSVAGRGVQKIPRHRKLPYWAQFTPLAFQIDQAQANAPLRADSTPDDLVNRSGAVLSVRRLVGRVLLSSTGAVGDSPDARELVNITMRDSHGIALVKDATPFGAVFPPPTFSLEVPFEMQKDDYLLATLTTQGFAAAATQFKANCSLALVGYREIE